MQFCYRCRTKNLTFSHNARRNWEKQLEDSFLKKHDSMLFDAVDDMESTKAGCDSSVATVPPNLGDTVGVPQGEKQNGAENSSSQANNVPDNDTI